jgi:hypothetical protein
MGFALSSRPLVQRAQGSRATSFQWLCLVVEFVVPLEAQNNSQYGGGQAGKKSEANRKNHCHVKQQGGPATFITIG